MRMKLLVPLAAALAIVLVTSCSSTSDKPAVDVVEDNAGMSDSAGQDTVPADTTTIELKELATEVTPDQAAPDAADVVPGETVETPDVFQTGISALGYAEFCKTDSDCSQWDLTCFRWGAEDVTPVCSTTCESSLDCPVYYPCDYKLGFETPQRICMPPRFCVACQDDQQCQLGGMRCVPDEVGGKFCSYPCAPGVLGCDAGSRCTYNETAEGWFCMPFAGACLTDGSHCAPCYVEEDCQAGHHCIGLNFDGEKFCSKECTTAVDCPDDSSCFDFGIEFGLCLMVADGEGRGTCHQGSQGFCQECRDDFECQDGMICYVSATGGGFYCTPECENDSVCAEGTRCKSSWNSDNGLISGFGCALLDDVTCQDLLEAEFTDE